ncbi:hypothetical protein EUGRSUZ_B03260 [Eucalyptus grandis]|uniref:Uncharacterized protein n=2 Tax=Eucalyptus grandis TaxID=71139 RepID=A0ACC3LWG7_EUCGR|nr:hypothetical protein EUGRSUZ_B03260 [Eucalyptus grandis]
MTEFLVTRYSSSRRGALPFYLKILKPKRKKNVESPHACKRLLRVKVICTLGIQMQFVNSQVTRLTDDLSSIVTMHKIPQMGLFINWFASNTLKESYFIHTYIHIYIYGVIVC